MIKIYSTPTCVYCKTLKGYFKKNGIEYQEYNVAADVTKRQEMMERTHQFGVPVIMIDNQMVIGFDKAKINELLGI